MEVKEVFVFCLMCKDEHVGHMSFYHINMWYKSLKTGITPKSKAMISLLVIISFLSSNGLVRSASMSTMFDEAKGGRQETCDPELPNLSVGDVWLDSGNFPQFKKSNKLFILGISNSQCDTCC